MTKKFRNKEIEDGYYMMKLIPNNFPVCAEDLEEIFSQKEKNGI